MCKALLAQPSWPHARKYMETLWCATRAKLLESMEFSSLKNPEWLEQCLAHSRFSAFRGMDEHLSRGGNRCWVSVTRISGGPGYTTEDWTQASKILSILAFWRLWVQTNPQAHGLVTKPECQKSLSHHKLKTLTASWAIWKGWPNSPGLQRSPNQRLPH